MRAFFIISFVCSTCILTVLSGCDSRTPMPATKSVSGDFSPVLPPPGVATEHTKRANTDAASSMNIARAKDQERASRGLLAQLERDAIVNDEGRTVWEVEGLAFLDQAAPDSAHPALWRQMQLTAMHGLFEVTDGIYQVRGYDLAVMTIIRGASGWIIVDPLTTVETAAAALELVQQTLGERPVSALIYTHSHADHFGGAEAIISAPTNDGRAIPVVAPFGFTEEAVSENLMAGGHMSRRSVLMYGGSLKPGPSGKIGSGLGPGLASGRISLVRPTIELPSGLTDREIDGVTFEFSDAGGTEAPSELVFYLPEFKALCTAEVVSGTFHNILTIRGAKVRDALGWSKAIDSILRRYSGRTEVMFASHHWPVWGAEEIEQQLRQHRDLYRSVHDQTLRYANAGATIAELPSLVEEPSFATDNMSVRGYYGSHRHNTKAVYQHYFGWWGGNPADFDAHPPVERGLRFVRAVGGAAKALALGQEAFADGDYRWAAEMLANTVFADPENKEARIWLASTYEQLGFVAESGATRNYYLTAAQELRTGKRRGSRLDEGADSFLEAVPTEALFDALAARYNPALIDRDPFTLQFVFTDTNETISVDVGRDAAFPRYGHQAEAPLAEFSTTRALFNRLVLKESSALMMIVTGKIKIAGKRAAVSEFFDALEEPPNDFPVATP